MKKLSDLKFWTVLITIFAFHAFVFHAFLLLNLDKYTGYESQPYPIAFYAIGFWLGKFLFFHLIPGILWLWYYIEIRKIKRYYQNLQINGMEIMASVGKELDKMVSIGIMEPKDAEDKKNELAEEYTNETTLHQAIIAEEEKLASLNSLKKLNAIDNDKYVLEKSKVKHEIKQLRAKRGLNLKLSSINRYVANSIFSYEMLWIGGAELLLLIISSYGLLENHGDEDKAGEIAIWIMFLTFLIWIYIFRIVFGFGKKHPSFWDGYENKAVKDLPSDTEA
jgi:hypothetical protein